ncbi:MAG: hypothetical protein H7174_01035, partial [Flavobacterium sp.]|nr:hypothetical protein [Flavobacterium sp.]
MNTCFNLKHITKAISFIKVFWCMPLFLVMGVVVKYYENLINIFFSSVVKLIATFKKDDDKIITLFFFIGKIEFKEKRNFIPSQKKIIQVGLLFLLVFGMSNSMKGQTIYTWNGAGVNGGTGGTDFNTAANWSTSVVPGAGSEARFNLNENTTSTVTLSSNTTIGKLTIVDATLIVTTNKQHKLDVGNFTLTVSGDCSVSNNCSGAVVDNGWYELNIGSSGTLSIGGNLTASNGNTSAANASNIIFFDNSGTMTVTGTTTAKSLNTGSTNYSKIQFNVGNSPAKTTFGGNLTLDDGTTVTNNEIDLSYSTGTSSTGTFVFKGNFNWGNLGFIVNTGATYIFDAPVSQTMTTNSSFYSNFNNVIIGSTNNPIVNIVTGTFPPDDILGNLTINGSSVLNLGTSQLNRNTNGGTFTMNGTSQLKLGGASTVLNNGTQTLITGSNFPSGFTINTLAATSTVEYNSLNGVNQTIYATPTYGHLTLTNATASGTTIKTAGGNLTVAGNLLINPLATFASSTFLHSVGGNWTNNGTFSFNSTGIAAKVTFTGASNTSISGSSPTDFYNLELNKGSDRTSILDI